MEAIYDSRGHVVGWRRRATIFDLAGNPRAFISQRALFTYDGKFLGRLEDGWYRDPEGHPVAFEARASGGPMRPVLQPGAVTPLPDPDPAPLPVGPLPPPPRIRSSKWSPLDWDRFLRGVPVANQ